MSKVDWSLAPEGATHYNRNNRMFYVLTGDCYKYYGMDGELTYGGLIGEYLGMIERPEPATWSGPQDGLPPVGTVCEFSLGDSNCWYKCEIKYVLADQKGVVAVCHLYALTEQYLSGCDDGYSTAKFRAIPTTAQLRETAIREIMDIADVDCRVTAARLVDAGFKREVV
jgi:hypothetical protein